MEIWVLDGGLQSEVDAHGIVQVSHLIAGDDNTNPSGPQTRRWFPTWQQSYDGNDSNFSGGTSDLYQGYYSGTHGHTKSMFGYDSADIQSKLSGATIRSVKLTFRVRHSYLGTGVDVRIRTHGAGSAPGTYPGGLTLVSSPDNIKAGQTKTVTLANSIGDDLKSGSTKGFGFGPGPTDAHDFYGYMYGIGSGQAPELTITYVK